MQTKVNEQMVQETYERLKKEVSASHILIKSGQNANPEDTRVAYQKAEKIKQRILSGENFDAVAQAESEDPSAKQNSGFLGYFSAMQMVFPFENAIFGNNEGDIVGPVKTKFGYHIIKVMEQRAARGKVLAAHIMIKMPADTAGMAGAKKKIDMIYANLEEGKDWTEQCNLYSDDARSKANGGQLNWFGTGNLVPAFEDAVFELKEKGDYSKPVQTRFGWHIIKLLDRKGIAPFDEMKADLEKKISRDDRSKLKKSTTLNNLKKSQKFKLDLEIKAKVLSMIDSSVLQAKWIVPSDGKLKKDILFTTNGKKYSAGDFFQFIYDKQKVRKVTDLKDYVGQLYNQYEERRIFDEELKNVEADNYEYKMVLDEYRSGILLFNLMEDKVWNAAMKDTLGLVAYYNDHLKNYKMDEHAITRRFVSADSSVLERVRQELSKTNSELDIIYNAEEPLTLQTFDEKIEKSSGGIEEDNWKVGSFIQKKNEYYSLYVISALKPDGFKEMDSIKGLVISDYQNELEKKWLKELKKKYPLKMSKSVMKNFISSLEN
jgi:peptidyl-prolyl cis-trans isomerase SurA